MWRTKTEGTGSREDTWKHIQGFYKDWWWTSEGEKGNEEGLDYQRDFTTNGWKKKIQQHQ